jgi:tRNA ligase
LADAYQHNHGIIQLRNDFLEHKNLKGSDIIRLEEDEADAAAIDGDIVLAPVATIGCGKTTIAVALSRLFGWGHIQNDNITGKRKPPIFTASILEQLKEKPVVFADRNNAQKREREQLITDLYLSSQSIRLVALHFVHTPETIDHIRRTTHERVFSRGDNHQNIQAATDRNKVIGIMEGFIKRFEPVDGEKRPDDAFDSIIELDPIAGSRANLEKVISELYEMYPGLFKDREMPSAQDLDDAITYALSEYKPDLKHEISTRDPKVPKHNKDTLQSKFASAAITPKKKPLEYISVSVPKQLIREVFENAFGEQRAQKGRFFRELQQTKRLQEAYHVTLIHRASSKQHPVLWQRYEAMWKEAGGTETKLGSCEVQLERVRKAYYLPRYMLMTRRSYGTTG